MIPWYPFASAVRHYHFSSCNQIIHYLFQCQLFLIARKVLLDSIISLLPTYIQLNCCYMVIQNLQLKLNNLIFENVYTYISNPQNAWTIDLRPCVLKQLLYYYYFSFLPFTFTSIFFYRSTYVGSTWSLGFFIPATTANDLRLLKISILDIIHYIIFFILILEKEPVFPFLMFNAIQGNYWYHFYNVFGMTRSLTGDWIRDLPHSKPALYH